MKLILLVAVWVCLLSSAVGGVTSADAGETTGVLKVGASSVEITPSTGETLDPLRARALAFFQEKEAAALVVCDLIGVSRELTDKVRRLGAEQTGIPAENICLAATHTHNGSQGCEDLAERIVQALTQAKAAARSPLWVRPQRRPAGSSASRAAST